MVNGSEGSGSPTIPMFGGPTEQVTPAEPGPAPENAVPAPGWYPDPWLASQRRYWTGDRWTLDTLPGGADPGPPAAPPTGWGSSPLGPDPFGPSPDRRRGRALIAVATVIGLLIGLGAAYAFSRRSSNNTASPPVTSPATSPTNPGITTPPNTTPTSIQPADSSDPGASSLNSVVVTQGDVTSPIVVAEEPGGNEVSGQTTLDVCNGMYPSEALRTARLQVYAGDPAASEIALSTEAVLYKNASATTQAFAELRFVAAHCPSTPVVSPVGEPTVATKFHAAPDGSWPQVAGVDRLAFDFTSTDA